MDRDNTPTFNVNRKVANYKDFLANPNAEKEELEKMDRQNKPNSDEKQKNMANSRYKFNNTTRKMDDLSPAEIEDKIDAIEELEGTNESIDIEDKKIEICNSINEMTQDRHSPKLDKWINSLTEEELNIIYNSIEKNDLLSKF